MRKIPTRILQVHLKLTKQRSHHPPITTTSTTTTSTLFYWSLVPCHTLQQHVRTSSHSAHHKRSSKVGSLATLYTPRKYCLESRYNPHTPRTLRMTYFLGSRHSPHTPRTLGKGQSHGMVWKRVLTGPMCGGCESCVYEIWFTRHLHMQVGALKFINRNYTTEQQSDPKTSQPSQQPTDQKLSYKDRIKKLFSQYGYIALVTHTCLSLVAFALTYTAINLGVNVPALIHYVGINMDMDHQTLSKVSTLAVAMACHKITMPFRIAITISVTPMVARFSFAKKIDAFFRNLTKNLF